jgi:phosphatidylglycerophosphatase A
MLGHPVHCLALGFGSGLSPVAPGTCGTLVGIPLYLLLRDLYPPYYLAAIAGLFLLGIYLCRKTSGLLGSEDPGAIVWDEIVGYLCTMTQAPRGWVWVLTGFMLFRVFDILKPWPIAWLDRRVKGGFGIMLDDLVAGVFSLIILQLIAYIL